MPINIVTSKSFSQGNSIPFKCWNLCLVLVVSYILKGICRLFASHTDSFDKSFIANELVLTETIAESILSDFDKALLLLILVDYLNL